MGRQFAVKQAGAFKRARTLHIKQAGTFVRARNAFIKQAGTWKPFLTPYNEWESIPNLLEITNFSAFSNQDTISTFLHDSLTPRIRNLNVLSGDVEVSLAPEAEGLFGAVHRDYHAGTWEQNKVAFITNVTAAGTYTQTISAKIYDVQSDTFSSLPTVTVAGRVVGGVGGFAVWLSREGWTKGYLVSCGQIQGTPGDFNNYYRLQIHEYDKIAETVVLKTTLDTDSFGIANDGQKWVTMADGRLLWADGAGGLRSYNPSTNSFFYHYVYTAAAGYDIGEQRQHPVTAGDSPYPQILIMPMRYLYTGEFESVPLHKKVTSPGVFEDLPLPNLSYEYGLPENAAFSVAVSPYSSVFAFNGITGLPESDPQKATLHLFYGD